MARKERKTIDAYLINGQKKRIKKADILAVEEQLTIEGGLDKCLLLTKDRYLIINEETAEEIKKCM